MKFDISGKYYLLMFFVHLLQTFPLWKMFVIYSLA